MILTDFLTCRFERFKLEFRNHRAGWSRLRSHLDKNTRQKLLTAYSCVSWDFIMRDQAKVTRLDLSAHSWFRQICVHLRTTVSKNSTFIFFIRSRKTEKCIALHYKATSYIRDKISVCNWLKRAAIVNEENLWNLISLGFQRFFCQIKLCEVNFRTFEEEIICNIQVVQN